MRLKIENLKTKQGFGYREVASGAILQSCISRQLYMFLKYQYNGKIGNLSNDVLVLRISKCTHKRQSGEVYQISSKNMYRILQAC